MGMPGLGTLINMGMILAGSLVGMLIGKGVPERFSKIIFQALGAATFLIGLSGVFTGMLQVGESGTLESSYTLLLILSLAVDGIMSVLFATVYGLGVPLSALSVGLYQGAVTLLAVLIKPYLTDLVVTQMSLVGSAVLMLIAFNLWDVKKINVANLIPAAFMPLLFSLFQGVLGRL